MPPDATHPDCFRLLRLLADGGIHSGDALASAVGCSRAGVSKRLAEAQGLGVPIRTVRGRGYRLEEPLDLIDRDSLDGLIASLGMPFRVDVLDECASTSTLLLERGLDGAAHASVIVCEHQIAGRGRRGAEWVATLGGSLAFSILWRFQRPAGELSGLSLALAVGVARGVERIGAGPVRVKWPNDLLLGERKLGGILVEMNGERPGLAVIGVGLNVRLSEQDRRRIAAPVAELAVDGFAPSRTVLLARLLQELAAVLEQFQRDGFAALREEWLARHAWQGRRVALKIADRCVAEGRAVGVAEDGALLLSSSRGLERFHAGELSLRQA